MKFIPDPKATAAKPETAGGGLTITGNTIRVSRQQLPGEVPGWPRVDRSAFVSNTELVTVSGDHTEGGY